MLDLVVRVDRHVGTGYRRPGSGLRSGLHREVLASLTSMTHHRRTSVVLVALAMAALGACGGSSGKSSEPARIATNGAVTVVARDISFDVGQIKTAPGPLTVTFKNE